MCSMQVCCAYAVVMSSSTRCHNAHTTVHAWVAKTYVLCVGKRLSVGAKYEQLM